jgi:hypothetical protein
MKLLALAGPLHTRYDDLISKKERTMNETIQGLWIGERLSRLERLSVLSFLENGHCYHLYCYGKVGSIPDGVEIRDAAEVLPSSSIFVDQTGSFGSFADFFRYKLLLEKGGWWVDLDEVCLKAFTSDADYVFSSEFHQPYGPIKVNNGIMKVPKGCEMIRALWNICLGKDIRKIQFGDVGPGLMQEVVDQFKLGQFVKDPLAFCPVPPGGLVQMLTPSRVIKISARTYGVHLWGELWRRHRIPKDDLYGPSCFYEQLQSIYCCANSEIRARAQSDLIADPPTFLLSLEK